MITIHDVAKKCGVSIATVSNVINNKKKVSEDTVQRVNEAIRELNYVPNNVAKGLKRNMTNTIGVIAEDIGAFSSPDIIDGICEYCETAGYQIILNNLRVNSRADATKEGVYRSLEETQTFKRLLEESIKMQISSRVGGIIYIGVHPRDVSHLIDRIDIPVVCTYCYAEKPCRDNIISVNYDDFQGAKMAVEYLIKNGHSKIAVISGVIDSIPSHRRLTGYQTALMESSLPMHHKYICIGNWSYKSGYGQMKRLYDLNEPLTAVFAMNDLMAYGAMAFLKERNLRIPDDISIHGFDNLSSAGFVSPPLTTVTIPLHQMGKVSAEYIIKMINDSDYHVSDNMVYISCSHIERESVLNVSSER